MERYRAPVRREDRVRVGLALELVAASTGVPKEVMEDRTRLEGVACRARWLAMYLSYVTFGTPVEAATSSSASPTLTRSSRATGTRYPLITILPSSRPSSRFSRR